MDHKLLRAIAEKAYWSNSSEAVVIEVNVCAEIIKDYLESHALVSKSRLVSIMENLEIIGNYGDGVVNATDIAMNMAQDIAAMIKAYQGESNE